DDGRTGVDQVGIAGDFPEAPGRIAAAPCENADGFIYDEELNTIAVELDFVNPARARRHLLNRGSKRRLDEPGEGRLYANRRRFRTLNRHKELHVTEPGFKLAQSEFVPDRQNGGTPEGRSRIGENYAIIEGDA